MANPYDPSLIMLVDNTGSNFVPMFHDVFIAAIKTGTALPDDIADLFTLEVKVINGQTRGILNFA